MFIINALLILISFEYVIVTFVFIVRAFHIKYTLKAKIAGMLANEINKYHL